MMHLFFQVGRRPTLLINALPAGVTIPSRLVSQVMPGPRPDSIVAALRQIAPAFTQIILSGEQPVLKAVAQLAAQAQINWAQWEQVHAITGAELMPENFRRYFTALTRPLAPPSQFSGLVSSFGISEIGLSLGLESPSCRTLRQALHDDAGLRQALLGDSPFAPIIVQYLPTQYFIETPLRQGKPRLVVTHLAGDRIMPLIRYTTEDWAQTWTYEDFCAKLRQLGREDLCPRYQLPVLAVWGRGETDGQGFGVYPEQVKEALYENHAVARALTANFQIPRQTALPGHLTIRFQLQPDSSADPAFLTQLAADLQAALARWTSVPVHLELVPYFDFHSGLELNYQRKFKYLQPKE